MKKIILIFLVSAFIPNAAAALSICAMTPASGDLNLTDRWEIAQSCDATSVTRYATGQKIVDLVWDNSDASDLSVDDTGFGEISGATAQAMFEDIDTYLDNLGVGLPDGDYGDIVASGTGAILSIDSGVIVNADINASAAISATKLIDGSITDAELGYINTLSSNAQSQIDGKQGSDSELSALAGLTSAANKIPMFSGAGTASLLDFKDEDDMVSDSATAVPSQQSVKAYVTAAVGAGVSDGDKGDIVVGSSGTSWTFDTGVVTAAAKTVLDDSSTSDMRATLGLSIGSNVQAYDADLGALAGVTSAANACPYFTGSATASTYTCSAGGRAVGGITGTSGAMIYFSGAQTAAEVTTSTGGRALLNAAGTANTFPYYSSSNTVSLQSITAGGRALGALTYAADTIGYTTSSSAASTTTLTSTARSILDDTSISAVKTTLGLRQEYCYAMSDKTTDLTTGTKLNFFWPAAATINGIRGYVETAPTGSTIIVDCNEAGTTIMSATKLSIDASEKTSGTAASAAVISDNSFAANAEGTCDIDQVGSTIKGKGLVVCLDVSF